MADTFVRYDLSRGVWYDPVKGVTYTQKPTGLQAPSMSAFDLGESQVAGASVRLDPYIQTAGITHGTGPLRQMAGQMVENIGDILGLPEGGWSERIAGGPTKRTNIAYAAEQSPPPSPAPAPAPSGSDAKEQLIQKMIESGHTRETAEATIAGRGLESLWQEYMGGGGQPSGPSPEELALQKAREAFSAAYQPIYEYLDTLAGTLPEWKQEKEQTLENLYRSQVGEIEQAQQAALAKFPTYREQIRQMQARSVRDLAEQLRNMLRAGAVYLGQAGAGDSSAAQMYAGALSKAAARGRADIIRQAMQQMQEINMKEADIKNTYQQQLAQLGTWKAQQLGEIADWYRQQQQELERMKATAKAEEQQAIAAQQAELINQAIARLNALDQEARQWETAMRSWAIQRLSEIDELKARYPELARWQPQGITIPQLKGLAGLGPRESVDVWWNPALAKKRKEEQKILSWLG